MHGNHKVHNGQTDSWTDGWMNEQTNGPMNGEAHSNSPSPLPQIRWRETNIITIMTILKNTIYYASCENDVFSKLRT